MQTNKISLKQAILININIMLSTGIFLNSITLVRLAGTYSPLIYILVSLFVLPLIFGISELLKIFPGGSFYTYAKETLGEKWGFISSWIYFTGKLASATIMTHFAVSILQSVFPALQILNPFVIDIFVISLFSFANMQNLKTGSKIQMMFFVLKSIPVLFIILSGLYLLTGKGFYFSDFNGFELILGVPMVIYAFSGFEASCSISRHIEDSKKNAPKAILTSYFIVVIATTLYQLVFSQLVSKESVLNNALNYTSTIPTILSKLNLNSEVFPYAMGLFQIFIALSALGGAYGILFSNSWNLYALAENGHILFKNKFLKLNKHQIPFLCLIAESAICFIYLFISKGNNVILQQIGAIGCTTTYTISMLSFLKTSKRSWPSIIGSACSTILLLTAIGSSLKNNAISIFVLASVMLVGFISFKTTESSKTLS